MQYSIQSCFSFHCENTYKPNCNFWFCSYYFLICCLQYDNVSHTVYSFVMNSKKCSS